MGRVWRRSTTPATRFSGFNSASLDMLNFIGGDVPSLQQRYDLAEASRVFGQKGAAIIYKIKFR
jgi:hypothetical protein